MKIGNLIEITEEDYRAFINIVGEMFKRLGVPKNKKNQIGIIVALKTENKEDGKKIETELISELNRYLTDSGEGRKFNVYSFPDHIVDGMNSKEEARRQLERSRGHFMLYGSVVQRKINKEKNYLFKLQGIVRHKIIKEIIKKQFEQEFSELLPSKIKFLIDEEGLYFELTKDLIDYIIKYIVAIAAFVSGDINLSDKLYKELKDELQAIGENNRIPVVQVIKNRLPIRLLETSFVYMAHNYFSFTKSRNPNDIFKSEELIKLVKSIDNENYGARLQNSIILFLKGDVDSAIEELEGRYNNADVTWRYSLGFLYAYKGDIKKALENYKKIFYKPVDENVCLDSEMFISDILKKEPDKIQLYFFRGILNYKIKSDYLLAKTDFELFLEHDRLVNFPELQKLTKKYLSEIKVNLGY